MEKERLVFVDNLRLFLIILVVLVHVSIIYGAAGNYPVRDIATDSISPIVLTMFNVLVQSFSMSLFFFLSGYFVPQSYDKKGTRKFIKDRLIRLGIPLLVYTTLFKVILDYLISNFINGNNAGFFEMFAYDIKHPGWMIGPLWFVEALLIFTLVYVIYRTLTKNSPVKSYKFPKNKSIILSMVLMIPLVYLVRIFISAGVEIHVFQFGYFIPYIFFFWLGLIAYRSNWLEQLSNERARAWKINSLILILILPVVIFAGGTENLDLFTGGLTFQSALYSTWETVACFSFIIGSISLFKNRLNWQGRILRWAAPNFYTVYIIHQFVIVPLMILFLGVAIPSIIKWIFVAFLGILICFLVSDLIRRIPYTRRVLG
jgi:glucans biosynthesis protein C